RRLPSADEEPAPPRPGPALPPAFTFRAPGVMDDQSFPVPPRRRTVYGVVRRPTSEMEIAMVSTGPSPPRRIVLVHGGFVDGSGWEAVYRILRKDGHTVSIVQNPTISLADDVRATRRVIAAQESPVVLVGHSYGGVVITEAGNDPRVAGLVYIAAFAPDK